MARRVALDRCLGIGGALLLIPARAISEPAGGTRSIWVHSPYTPSGQPNPLRVDLSPQAAPTGVDEAGGGPRR